MADIDYRALAQWALSGDTGISSNALAATLADLPCPYRERSRNYPHDGDDMGRCIRLLKVVPSLRPHLHKMRGNDAIWNELLDRWDEIERVYDACMEVATVPIWMNTSKDWKPYHELVHSITSKEYAHLRAE